MVLEKTLESPLDCKEIQLVHPKGDQSWVFIGRTNAEAETPILLPGKFHGLRSLVGYSPWGCKESDRTEQLNFQLSPDSRASLVAQLVKNMPAMQEAWVLFLGGEDHLEKRKAPHSSILAWRIPWTEEPGRLQSMGLQRVGYD